MHSMTVPLSMRRALTHLGLALLVTWTIVPRFGRHLLGHGDVDIWNHAWGAWWWWENLSVGQIPWRTRLLQWSDGGVLWFIDPVLAAIGVPIVFLFGPVIAFNLVLVGYVAFASWAIGRFAKSLGASQSAQWVASCGYIGSAWLSCELHNGITEAVNIGPVALALAWTEDAARKNTGQTWARAGLGVGLATLASPYLGLGTGIAALVRGLPRLRRAWIGGLVAIAVSAPPTLALRAQLRAPDAIVKHPEEMNIQLALHNAVDPRTFFQPFGFRSVDLSTEGFEHSMYLGWIILGLAVLALKKSRSCTPSESTIPARSIVLWLGGAVLCLVVSLGPYLFWNGEWASLPNGARFRLPWWALQQIAPGLAITHPLRLAVPALAILCALAAVGLPQRFGHRQIAIIAILILGEGLILSGAPWPIATADAQVPTVYQRIDDESNPMEWGILDLPSDAGETMGTSRYLFWQTSHGRPIPYGPDARASTNALLHRPAFRALARHSRRRADESARLNLDSTGEGGTDPRQLLADGIRWIVVHPEIDPDAANLSIQELESSLGPGEDIDGHVLWDLNP